MSGENNLPKTQPKATQKKSPKKKGCLGRLLKAGFVALLLAVLAAALLPSFLPTGWIRDIIVREVNTRTGMQCSLKEVKLGAFDGISLRGFSLRKDKGQKPVVEIGKVVLDIDLSKLVKGIIYVNRLLIDKADITIRRDKQGELNIEKILKAAAATPTRSKAPPFTASATVASQNTGGKINITAKEVRLTNTAIRYIDESSGMKVAASSGDMLLASDNLESGISITGDITPLVADKEIGKITIKGNADLIDSGKVYLHTADITFNVKQLSAAKLLEIIAPDQFDGSIPSFTDGTIRLTATNGTPNLSGNISQAIIKMQNGVTIPQTRLTFNATADIKQKVITLTQTNASTEACTLNAAARIDLAKNTFVADLKDNTIDIEKAAAILRPFYRIPSPAPSGLIRLDGQIFASENSRTMKLGFKSENLRVATPDEKREEYSASGNIECDLNGEMAQIKEIKLASRTSSAILNGSINGFTPDKATAKFEATGDIGLSMLEAFMPKSDGAPRIYGSAKIHAASVTLADGVLNSALKLSSSDLALTPSGSKDKIEIHPTNLEAECTYAQEKDLLTIKRAVFTSPQLASAANGIASPRAGRANLGLSARITPADKGNILMLALPGKIAKLVKVAESRGRLTIDGERILLTQAKTTGELSAANKKYTISADNNVEFDLGNANAWELRKCRLDILDDDKTAANLSVSGKSTPAQNGTEANLSFAMDADAQGMISILKTASAASPEFAKAVNLPHSLAGSGTLSASGTVMAKAGTTQCTADINMKDGYITDGADKILLSDKAPSAHLQAAYSSKSETVRIENLRMNVAGGEVGFTVKGVLAKSGGTLAFADWSPQPGSIVNAKVDIASFMKTFPSANLKGWKISGTKQVELTITGSKKKQKLKAHTIAKNIVMQPEIKGMAPVNFGDSDTQFIARFGEGKFAIIESASIKTPFAQIEAKGEIDKFVLGKDSLSLGNGSHILFGCSITDGEKFGKDIIASALGADKKIALTGATVGGRISAEKITLPGDGQNGHPTPYAFMTGLQLRSGIIEAQSITYDTCILKDVKAKATMNGGLLEMKDGAATLQTPAAFTGAVDFRPLKPECAFTINAQEIPMLEAVGTVSDWGQFTDGTGYVPDPSHKGNLGISWKGLKESEIRKSLYMPKTPFLIKNCEFLSFGEGGAGLAVENIITGIEKAIIESILDPIGVGDLTKEKLTARMTKARKTTRKTNEKIRTESISALCSIANETINIHDLFIKGINMPNYRASGIIKFNGDLRIRIYLTPSAMKDLGPERVVDIVPNEVLRKSVKNSVKDIMRPEFERLAEERKIYVDIYGKDFIPTDIDRQGLYKTIRSTMLKTIRKAVSSSALDLGAELLRRAIEDKKKDKDDEKEDEEQNEEEDKKENRKQNIKDLLKQLF